MKFTVICFYVEIRGNYGQINYHNPNQWFCFVLKYCYYTIKRSGLNCSEKIVVE